MNTPSIVLVEPETPGNIGSVCRAMGNTGFDTLVLVNPCPYKVQDAYMMARNSSPILDSARTVSSLREAIAPASCIIGFTRRIGNSKKNTCDLPDLSDHLSAMQKKNHIAFVFGRESKGLSNEETALCDKLCRIPSHNEAGSFNLAQAVMLACYTIFIHRSLWTSVPKPRFKYAASLDKEAMFDHIARVLTHIGYTKRGSKDLPRLIMANLRAIFTRTGLEVSDVETIRGICSQIETAVSQKGSQT